MTMKKAFLFISCMSLFCFGFYSEIGYGSFKNKEYKVSYRTKDGMFDGAYVSYFLHGKKEQKRAEGQFLCNQRIGKWSFWDSTGKLLVVREYKNDFEFKQIFPKSHSKGKNPIVFSLSRNGDGCYSSFEFDQNDIVMSKRVWRYISFNDTLPVFKDNELWKQLITAAKSGNLSAYSSENDEFTSKVGQYNAAFNSADSNSEILGYKIKEDWYFDKDRKTSEKGIIGICPVIGTRGKDSTDVCWFYFSDIRRMLASIPVNISSYPKAIENLDDVFFFRCFRSVIYKETNVKNQSFSDYCRTNAAFTQESLRTDIELIEAEHELWAKYPR